MILATFNNDHLRHLRQRRDFRAGIHPREAEAVWVPSSTAQPASRSPAPLPAPHLPGKAFGWPLPSLPQPSTQPEGQAATAGSVPWGTHSTHTLCYPHTMAAAGPISICTQQVCTERKRTGMGGGDRGMEGVECTCRETEKRGAEGRGEGMGSRLVGQCRI